MTESISLDSQVEDNNSPISNVLLRHLEEYYEIENNRKDNIELSSHSHFDIKEGAD